MPSIESVYEKLLDQFTDCPNWNHVWTIFCELIDENEQCCLDLMSRTWLSTAAGVWLDRCGEILGLPRPYQWDEDGLFTWDSSVADERWDAGVWSSSEGIQTDNPVSDTVYRNLLYARANYTNSNNSVPTISRFITDTFGVNHTITVPAVDTVQIVILDPLSQFNRYYLTTLAPVAAGVTLILI